MVASDDAVRHFVREVLGCGCPEEVLQRLSRDQADLPDWLPACDRIDVGGRLLVFVLAVNGAEVPAADWRQLIGVGRDERDRLGFNRFRLVIPAAEPAPLRGAADRALAEVAAGDDKLHVHVVQSSQVPRLTARSRP